MNTTRYNTALVLMGGIRFYTGLLHIKESKFTVVDNVYLFAA